MNGNKQNLSLYLNVNQPTKGTFAMLKSEYTAKRQLAKNIRVKQPIELPEPTGDKNDPSTWELL